jgi:transposase-like protein
LLPLIREHVLPESIVYTDELRGYEGIGKIRGKDGKPAGYRHHRIKHSARVYVIGDVHTNTIEGFWSLLKRGIGGVYHSIAN